MQRCGRRRAGGTRLVRRWLYEQEAAMSVVKVLLILLAVWVLIGLLGLVIKGLFWLFVLGCVAFTVTSIVGALRRKGIVGRR